MAGGNNVAKTYCLYLDESGDFDKDLEKERENECIVGGILMNADDVPSEYELENIWVAKWKEAFPERMTEPKSEILKLLHHATELEPSIKATTIYTSLNLFSKLGSFVIFENYEKSRIVDSTITYANILCEGIVQLLLRLALDNPDTKVKLDIMVGGRRDMTEDTVKYIDLTVLKSRVEERLRLLDIKNESLKAMGASYNISIGNDKKVTYLIMCDYICHFYFRRNAYIYKSKLDEEGRSYCDVLLHYYNPQNIFSLKGNAERERVAQHIASETYGSMLFDIAIGIIEEENNVDNALAHFFLLPEKSRRLHLTTLSNLFKEILEIHRDLSIGERIISFGDRLLDRMEKEKKVDDRFSLELLLYKLTIENHKGNLNQMQRLFNEANARISGVMEYSENIDLVFMLFNRYAVFLFDSFEVEKAYLLLNKTIDQFEAYELIGCC